MEYASVEELPSQDRLLADAAIEAVALSYAPYSNFNVGAAVMFEDGEIVKGANQENAAYPSGLCAERTALFYAGSSYPDTAVVALAIAAYTDGTFTRNPIADHRYTTSLKGSDLFLDKRHEVATFVGCQY